MPPGSPPSKGFRGFLKRCGRRVKDVLRSKPQAPALRAPSPQRQPQPPPGASLPPPAPAQKPTTQLPTQSHRSLLLLQPVPSASGSTSTANLVAASGVQAANADSRLAQAASKAGTDAWTGLKITLGLVKESTDVFPPLKSAVAGFLGVVHIFETASQNREEYANLASNLQAMVHAFTERPGEQTSSNILEALNAMESGLEKEIDHVQKQQQHSGLRRHLEAGQDSDDVQECKKRVESLRHALQDKAMLRLWKIGEEQQVDARLEKLNAAVKAMYDSSMSTVIGRRECTPGTREAILAGMREWADSPGGPKVYWLNGMAGTGKTTLAYSFCTEMKLAGRLGASFFCSRTDADSQDVSRIVPTIAYQLARVVPSYRDVLIRQIGEDKDIGARNTETQFAKLIRDPLRATKASELNGIVVTIDALDECDRRDGAQDILNVLLLNASDLPIKFLVTCRPEPGLFDVLQSQEENCRSVLHLHEIEASFVQADIRTYLDVELGAMSLPREKIEQLAEQAGALFIYAATAVRYIRPKGRQVNVYQRLEQLLSMVSEKKTNKHKGIDELYAAVLTAPLADEDLDSEEKENIRLVIDTAICAREPMSATTMARLLELDDDHIQYALQHLRSVLHVSQGAGLISTLHASFPDFMLDRNRSKDLFCEAPKHHQRLAVCCFRTMRSLLRFNICDLESSFVLDEKVPDLKRRADRAISPELFYACCYWGDHLRHAEVLGDLESALDDFLTKRLLFWMEVMNLKNCMSIGPKVLSDVHGWLQISGGRNEVLELALDASMFMMIFSMSPASRSTPHIYISALPFWPKTRPVKEQHWKQTQGLMRTDGPARERRDLSCVETWSVNSPVRCVAFSPDNTCIVSGSYDNAIRVWDAGTGALIAGPFEGHTDWVNSVGFSPDGTRIVSGSGDNAIRVWDVRTGALVAGPFEGHTSWVNSVGFSPDGTRIVSGSDDSSICVWDARTGALLAGPFEGHTDSVRSVGFSPDGTRIVSGSKDNTIRVWGVGSNALVAGPFEGHTGMVYSVGFSPDGTRIVSGSTDNTIRVWNARTGALVAGPFEGHTGSARSVGFSPDGTRIVSGSYDRTIRVWKVPFDHTHDSGALTDWLMDDNGMVTAQKRQLLIYVPRDLWTGLIWPQNTVYIYGLDILQLDFSGVSMGTSWAECYRSQ